jgi:hypothetical protein
MKHKNIIVKDQTQVDTPYLIDLDIWLEHVDKLKLDMLRKHAGVCHTFKLFIDQEIEWDHDEDNTTIVLNFEGERKETDKEFNKRKTIAFKRALTNAERKRFREAQEAEEERKLYERLKVKYND